MEGSKGVLAEGRGCVRMKREEHSSWRAGRALRSILDVEPKEERTKSNKNQVSQLKNILEEHL